MRGRSEKIMELHYDGKTATEIAEELNCTVANVCQTIKRRSQWENRVKPLPSRHANWLVDTAERHGVKPESLASKLLEQMIDVYMTKEHK